VDRFLARGLGLVCLVSSLLFLAPALRAQTPKEPTIDVATPQTEAERCSVSVGHHFRGTLVGMTESQAGLIVERQFDQLLYRVTFGSSSEILSTHYPEFLASAKSVRGLKRPEWGDVDAMILVEEVKPETMLFVFPGFHCDLVLWAQLDSGLGSDLIDRVWSAVSSDKAKPN